MASLRRTAVAGFLWQAFALVGQRFVVFGAYILYARFLTKEEIGIVGVAVAITVFVDMLRAGGILQALIQFPEDDDLSAAINATFWLTLATGICWTLILVGVSFPLAAFTESELIGPIMMALATTALIENLRLVPMAKMSRQLRFRQRAAADTAASLTGAIVGVGALFTLEREHQVWSIVIMFVTRSIVATVAHYLFAPISPKRSFDKAVARRLAKVGWQNLSSNLASGTLENLTLVAVRYRTNFDATGIFDMATRAMSPPTSIAHAANSTLFPILAQVARDLEKVRDRVLRSVKTVGLIAAALLSWLAVISPSALPLLFGEKWNAAVVPAQLIAIGIIFRTYTYICTNAFLATGRAAPASLTWWTTLAAAALLFLFWPMSGMEATTPALIFISFNAYGAVVALVSASRQFELATGPLLAALAPAAVCAGVATAGAWTALAALNFSGWAHLFVGSALYALLFVPLCGKMMGGSWSSLFSPRGARELLRMN